MDLQDWRYRAVMSASPQDQDRPPLHPSKPREVVLRLAVYSFYEQQPQVCRTIERRLAGCRRRDGRAHARAGLGQNPSRSVGIVVANAQDDGALPARQSFPAAAVVGTAILPALQR